MKPRVEEKEATAKAKPSWTSEDLLEAVNRAVTVALRRHKQRGESIVIWRDGHIAVLKPEEIDV